MTQAVMPGPSDEAASAEERRYAPVVAAATAIALCLRLTRIGADSLWRDEAFQWWSTTFSWSEVAANASRDVHSPLYHLITKAFVTALGDSEAVLRLPSALLMTAAVPLIGALGRRAGGPIAGMIAAWIASLAPALVRYGQETRSYGLFVFASALAILALARTLGLGAPARTGLRDGLLLAVGATLLAFAHPFGPFAVAAMGIPVVVTWRVERRFPAQAALGLGVAGAAFALYLPMLLRQVADVRRDFWITPLPLANVVSVPGFMLRRGAPRVLTVALAILVLAAATRLSPRWRVLAASMAVTCWVGPAVHALVGQPIFQVNYAFALAPLAAAVLGVAIARLGVLPRRVVATVLLAGLASDSAAYLAGGPHKERWREGCALVVAAAREGATPVLVTRTLALGQLERCATRYYTRGLALREFEATEEKAPDLPPGRIAIIGPRDLEGAVRAALAPRRIRELGDRGPLDVLALEAE